ncbi:hypothetical protein QPK87_36300 [Kamptonema cortianum]|nr:hypothetical protein [Kamptonema cortianum]MDL5050091.1 hypothetical protein [Oscillatoria amoena NRMC-F 0135]
MSEDTTKSKNASAAPRTAREEARDYGIDVDLLDEQIAKTPDERFESLIRMTCLLQQINPHITEQNVRAKNDSERPAERAI